VLVSQAVRHDQPVRRRRTATTPNQQWFRELDPGNDFATADVLPEGVHLRIPARVLAGGAEWKEHKVTESTTSPPARSGLLVVVEELTAVHDRYDSLRSDNSGSSGDSPWPGGDGNLNDTE